MSTMKLRWMAGLAGLLCSLGAMAQQPMTPSPMKELLMSNNDKSFFEKAASAGMYEIQAAKLAETTSSNPQIKAFADQMVTDHTAAASELQTLAQSKNVTLPTALLPKHQKMLDHLNGKTGAAFDKAYIHEMVASHKEAVSLFDNAAKHSKDPDVKAFASKTLPTLEHHGGMAKALKA